jgi:outer membrane protein assembly factor BamA
MNADKMNVVKMNRIARFILVLPLLLVAAVAQKQSAGPVAAKLIAVKVKGTARYTDQEITAGSGLQIGQPAADGDFKEAVQRLGNSGMFSEAAYSFSSSSAGVRLELQLGDTDKSKLVPVHFENFVGFTDEELLAAVQPRVPLFKGLLPLGGTLPDHVSEALQAILTEKKLPGRVSFLREGDEASGQLSGIAYRVDEVSIRISNVEFPGASPEQTPLLAKAARRLTGAEYSRSTLAATEKFDLLPVYLQRGYLKAAFGPSDARVVPQSMPGNAQSGTQDEDTKRLADLQVNVIVPVTPGKIYSTSTVDWKGNSAIPTAELAPLLHLPLGQPADAVQLVRDLENVTKLYCSRGYIAVKADSSVQFDDEKGTVRYDLNVVEGDRYKMGELEITGLDTQARSRMEGAWTLQEGQPYNADYPKKFLEDTRQLLPRGVQWNTTVHESADAKSKTVDVEIHFKLR